MGFNLLPSVKVHSRKKEQETISKQWGSGIISCSQGTKGHRQAEPWHLLNEEIIGSL